MIKMMYLRIAITVILIGTCDFLFAQATADSVSNINTGMTGHDKIYVVMAVCITILAGLFLYLIRIDTKVSKKEKLS